MHRLSIDNRLIMLSLFLWGMGEGQFTYLLPLYLSELGANPIQIGSILALAAAGAVITHIPTGYIADRLGRKPIIMVGFGLAAAVTLVMYLAPDLRLFVPALVIYQFTSFLSGPLSAYITGARGTQSIQRAITLVWIGYWSALIVSPTIGGLIARSYGIRSLFGIALVLFVLSFFILLPLNPQVPEHRSIRLDRYKPLLTNWNFLHFLGLVFAVFVAMQLGMPLAPNFVSEVRGFDVWIIGLLGTCNSIGSVVLHLFLGGRMPQRMLVITQIMMAAYIFILLSSHSLPWLLVAFFFRSSWHLAHGMTVAQIGQVVSQSNIGLALGFVESVYGMALVLGPIAAGWLYELAPELPFQVSLILILLTIGLVWRFAPQKSAESSIAAWDTL